MAFQLVEMNVGDGASVCNVILDLRNDGVDIWEIVVDVRNDSLSV